MSITMCLRDKLLEYINLHHCSFNDFKTKHIDWNIKNKNKDTY